MFIAKRNERLQLEWGPTAIEYHSMSSRLIQLPYHGSLPMEAKDPYLEISFAQSSSRVELVLPPTEKKKPGRRKIGDFDPAPEPKETRYDVDFTDDQLEALMNTLLFDGDGRPRSPDETGLTPKPLELVTHDFLQWNRMRNPAEVVDLFKDHAETWQGEAFALLLLNELKKEDPVILKAALDSIDFRDRDKLKNLLDSYSD